MEKISRYSKIGIIESGISAQNDSLQKSIKDFEENFNDIYLDVVSQLKIIEDETRILDRLTITRVYEEMKHADDILLPVEEIKSILTEKLMIRNHMHCIHLNITDIKTQKKIKVIDLEQITSVIENANYDKETTPSVVMFADPVYCCGILTKKCTINLVGGAGIDEIKFSILKFLTSLAQGFKQLKQEATIKIGSIKRHNMAVSTSIPLCKIDTLNATSLLHIYQVNHIYISEDEETLRIRPLKSSLPSVFGRVFQKGGIFLYGMRSEMEVNLSICIIISFLHDYLRYNRDPGTTIENWREEKDKSRKLHEENKARKRAKTITKWLDIKNKNASAIVRGIKDIIGAEDNRGRDPDIIRRDSDDSCSISSEHSEQGV